VRRCVRKRSRREEANIRGSFNAQAFRVIRKKAVGKGGKREKFLKYGDALWMSIRMLPTSPSRL